MPSLKDIRRRIQSVEKTQQITRAMRMVAAAKLRRAQDAILAARPYAERMHRTLLEVASSQRPAAEHPLLVPRESVRRLEMIVVTSDRGLCGAFNANILKRAQTELLQREPQLEGIALTLVGRKAADFYRRRRPGQIAKTFGAVVQAGYPGAVEIAEYASQRYLSQEVDEVLLLHSEFVSALSQQPRLVRLVPVSPEQEPSGEGEEALPYEIEPSAEQLLQVLVPKAIEVEVYRALLDSEAGEHAARMTAMESATRNTEELIDSLTLQYNRARQAAITKELVEIVTGAEAL
jgi:F-type H+-transporting ATPase subunit gamma